MSTYEHADSPSASVKPLNLNFIDPAAQVVLEALIVQSHREGDGSALAPGTSRLAWATAYPAYAANWDHELSMTAKIAQAKRGDDRARQIAFAIAQDDTNEIVKAAVAAHRHQKLIDSGADKALADEFAALCVDSDTLDRIDIPDPLIEGFINKSSLVRIFGPSNSKKSFVGLDMAGCVGAGIPWHGNGTCAAKVLYIVAEGADTTIPRVRAWEKLYGRKWEGTVYPHAVQIGDPNQFAKLVAFATIYKFEFVVFDTQARCTVGIDENDNTDMGVIVDALDDLKAATGAAVMLVHHSGGSEAERARGATAVYGAMDAEFKVSCKEMNISFETKKRKGGAQAEVLQLTAKEDTVPVPVCKLWPTGQTTSLALVSGYVSASLTHDEVMSLPRLTKPQTDTLVALARYDQAGASPTALAIDQGLSKDDRNKVGKTLGALERLDCGKKQGSGGKYVITDRGWAVLEGQRLTTGFHEVADLAEPQDDPEEATDATLDEA